MENASKALLMIAGVLIAISILSIGVYLYSIFSTHSKDVENEINEQRIRAFNAQFLAFDGKDDLTIYDVINIINLAKNFNNNNDYEEADSAYIHVKGSSITLSSSGAVPFISLEQSDSNTINNWIIYTNQYIFQYKIAKKYKIQLGNVKIDANSGKVNEIIITDG